MAGTVRILATLAILWSAAPIAAGGAVLPPPIAQAAGGDVECYSPDIEHKTCGSMDSFTLKANGSIKQIGTAVLVRSPAIVSSMESAVTIKAGRVCVFVTLEAVGHATFTIDGVQATPEQTAKLRDRMQTASRPLYNREICAAYVTDGDTLRTEVSVDGVAQPSANEHFIWIPASDGYKVHP